MKRVITVTLNPAIDETVTLDTLRPGHVHRASSVVFHAGGKGVNVASCLADWGADRDSEPVIGTGILGQGNAGIFEAIFAAKKITDRFIRVAGDSRTNIKLSHDGDTTDINLPGLTIEADITSKIRKTIIDLAGQDTLVLLAGSVPAGIGPNFYAELTEALNARGAHVLLDTSGTPLAAALQAVHLPYCIKPNRVELEAFAGRALPANEDMIAVAQAIRERGVALVVVSLGAQGALFIGDHILHAALPVLRAASTVGAGDAMVAGIIAAMREDADIEGIACLATAFAVAKLSSAGPNLPARTVIEALCADVQTKKIGEFIKS